METFAALIIPCLLLILLLRIISLPIRWIWKLIFNSSCGFLCLWILNWVSGITGILFPINGVTAAIAGFLGLPGIVFLVLAQILL